MATQAINPAPEQSGSSPAQRDATKTASSKNVRVSASKSDVLKVQVVDTHFLLFLKSGAKVFIEDGALNAAADPDYALVFIDEEASGQSILAQAEILSGPSSDRSAWGDALPGALVSETFLSPVSPSSPLSPLSPLSSLPLSEPDGSTVAVSPTAEPKPFFSFAKLGSIAAGVGALVGLAGLRSDPVASISEVTTTLNLMVVAGPVISQLRVTIVDAFGNPVAIGLTHADGTIEIAWNSASSAVDGLFMILVESPDANADYVDEATGERVNLDVSLRAFISLKPGSSASVSVTPLTELAVQKAGLAQGDVDPSNISLASAVAANVLTASLFGIADVTGDVIAVIGSDGGVSSKFIEADGISDAEAYGRVLAMLSGNDAVSGSLTATLAAYFVLLSNETIETQELAVVVLDQLFQGASTFQNSGSEVAELLTLTTSEVSLRTLLAPSALSVAAAEAQTSVSGNALADGLVSPEDYASTASTYSLAVALPSSVLVGDVLSITIPASGDGLALTLTRTLVASDIFKSFVSITFTASQLLVSGDGSKTITAQISGTDGASVAYTAFTLNDGLLVVDTGVSSTTSTSISGVGISADIGSSDSDFVTATASQTITASLSAALVTGDILYGSVTGGSDWLDITSKVSGTAISWDSVTLLASSSAIVFKITDLAGNESANLGSTSYTLDTWVAAPTLNLGVTGASVTGFFYTGILAGHSEGAISNSYTTGAVSGHTYVGGLVGNNAGTISGSYSTATVSGSSGYLGGLAGSNYGTITGSYAKGAVTGTGYYAGGLVGGNNRGKIKGSYATGAVTGTGKYLGGLVGDNYDSASINDSYATGAVSGVNTVGGLVGYNRVFSTITNSYATGAVTGTDSVGALVGAHTSTLPGNTRTVINSYWDTETSNQSTSAAGTGLGSTSIKQQSNFSGWDFDNTWVIYDGYTAPLLRSFMTALTVTASDAQKTYDGLVYSGVNTATYSLASPDSSKLLGELAYSGTSLTSKNAGTYAIDLSGLYSGQDGYIISYASGALAISKAALTVTATQASKTYDGTTSASGVGSVAALAGAGAGETVLSYGSQVFTDMFAGTGKTVIASGVTLKDASGVDVTDNYSISYVDNTTSSIAQAALTVTATETSKAYDGTTSASGMGSVAALAGAGAGETVLSYGSQVFADMFAGTGKTVIASGVTLKDASGVDVTDNYSISYADNTTSSIIITAAMAEGGSAAQAASRLTVTATLPVQPMLLIPTTTFFNLAATPATVFQSASSAAPPTTAFQSTGPTATPTTAFQSASSAATLSSAPLTTGSAASSTSTTAETSTTKSDASQPTVVSEFSAKSSDSAQSTPTRSSSVSTDSPAVPATLFQSGGLAVLSVAATDAPSKSDAVQPIDESLRRAGFVPLRVIYR